MMDRPGYDLLWGYFGLSYASFLTIPRVLLHEMPDEWQMKLYELLMEYEETFPNQPALGTTVRITNMHGKLIKTPGWILRYRHPDKETINKLRSTDKPPQEE